MALVRQGPMLQSTLYHPQFNMTLAVDPEGKASEVDRRRMRKSDYVVEVITRALNRRVFCASVDVDEVDGAGVVCPHAS